MKINPYVFKIFLVLFQDEKVKGLERATIQVYFRKLCTLARLGMRGALLSHLLNNFVTQYHSILTILLVVEDGNDQLERNIPL